MRFSIEPRGDHLLASLQGRETGEEMRAFLVAVHAACGEHKCPRILMSIRASRPVFKPEDYGISTYVHDLVTDKCQVALVGDTPELNAAHEYIEVCARQQNMNVRAFADEASALRWLRNSGTEPELSAGAAARSSGSVPESRRYKFTRIVLQGAPEEPGVYALWDGEELVYYGRGTVRSSLLTHLERTRATHYSWEVCSDPAAREAELLREYQRAFGRPPRENAKPN
ncbi:MAG TPA: hypothetical protein VIV54_08355 [Burkholderiales bacterium]